MRSVLAIAMTVACSALLAGSASAVNVAGWDFSDSSSDGVTLGIVIGETAEVVLEEALRVAWRDLTERHGVPRCTDDGVEREAGFGIIAYGMFAGQLPYTGEPMSLLFQHLIHILETDTVQGII